MLLLNSAKIIDPTYKILNFIQSQNKELLNDDEYMILFGNLKTHFLKLFYSVIHIYDIQKDNDFMVHYNQTKFVGTMLVEYPYIKLSTIWDIAYQIGNKLTNLKNPKGNKYEELEREFSAYAKKFNNLNISWYREVNKIRNRIVHGGIKITPFYLDKNEQKIKNRLCFQAYNYQLNDLITVNYLYSNMHNNDINFADNYFALYTNVLYCYLIDFFDFILLKLCDKYNLNSTDFNEHENSNIYKTLGLNDGQYWEITNMEKFKKITIDMLKLYFNKGDYIGIDKIIVNESDIERVFPIIKTY